MKGNLVLLTAGGTGGHMFPAQALSEILLENGWRVKLSTDIRGARFLENFSPNIDVNILPSATLFGGGLLKRFAAPWLIIKGSLSAIIKYKRDRPCVVIGFGGYPTIPGLVAAIILKIPIVIQEQNGVLGLVNRIFSSRAKILACGTWPTKAPEKVNKVFTGNPVRLSIMKRAGSPYIPPGEYPMSILVIGGSQGAGILSKIVPKAFSLLPDSLLNNLRVSHQARLEDSSNVKAVYESIGIDAFVSPFFNDIENRYSEAQLIISRAGASSVADISIIGRPSILIPFAAALSDHQTANAKSLSDNGAAILILEKNASPEIVAQEMENILMAPKLAQSMADKALNNGNPEAIKKLYDVVCSVHGNVK